MYRVAVALVDSLLTAMVRANGDALVMHVGEKPIVVARSRSIDLSSHGLNLNAMVGMLAQLLPAEAQASLQEFGAVEHRLPTRGTDQFTVVAARGGDDIWIEIRRRREGVPSETEVPERAAAPAEPVTARPADSAPSAADATVAAAPAERGPVAEAASPAALAAAHPAPELDVAPTGATDAPVEEEPTPAAPEPEAALEEGAAPTLETGLDMSAPPQPPAQSQWWAAPELQAEGQLPTADLRSQVELTKSEWAAEADERAAEPELSAERDGQATHEVQAGDEGRAEAQPVPAAETEPLEVPVAAPLAPAGGSSEPVSQPETATTEAPTELPRVLDTPAQVVSTGEDQEESPVRPDAETRRPLAEEFATPPLASEVTITEAGASVIGEPRPVPAMASVLAGGPPSAAPVPEAGPPSGVMGAPSAAPAEPPAAFAASSVPPPGDLSKAAAVTRTVRIEVPSRSSAPRPASVERLLRLASERGATELFLMAQARPYVRIGGEVRLLPDEPALSAVDLDAALSDVTPEPSRDAVSRGESVEWLIELADVGRVRCASFRDQRGPGAVLHLLSARAASAEQLGLDADARSLATEPDGLVVVAGPAGSDKSAILSAFVDEINRHRADYMITIEPFVYLIHENVQALVSQREVGADPARAAAAARAALKEDPDILVIDDLASGEVAALAVEAASQGRLVLVSLEAGSTAEAVQRLIELVPADKRGAARSALARTFRGAIAQQLVRKAAGGRVAARELLMGTGAVLRVLADQTRGDVAQAIEAARDGGSAALADAMAAYVKAGVVDVREAFRKAPNRERLMTALREAGVSTAAIERLQ
jgi:twitching motility protein PilT